MKLLISISLSLVVVASPAAAIETCRFIQAKAEREACYHRQEDELAAKRKPEPARSTESRTLQSLQEMRRDDEQVYRSIRGICNGC